MLTLGGAEADKLLPGYSRAGRIVKNVERGFIVLGIALYLLIAIYHDDTNDLSSVAIGALIAALNAWCFFFLLVIWGIAAIQTRNAVRVLGSRTLRYAVQARRVYLNAKGGPLERGSYLALSLIFVALAVLGAWGGFWCVAGVAMVLISYPFSRWTEALIPPTILVLSASRPDVLDMVVDIRGQIPFYRVVTLLESSHGVTVFAREFYNQDGFRASGSNWKSTVIGLAQIVSIIVVDLRYASDPIAWEISQSLEEDLLRKTVYVVGEKGECDGLRLMEERIQKMYSSADQEVFIATPATIAATILAFLRTIKGGECGGIPRIALRRLIEPMGGLHTKSAENEMPIGI